MRFSKLRGTDGKKLLTKKFLAVAILPVTGAKTQGKICFLQIKKGGRIRGGQTELMAGHVFLQGRETRHQPQMSKAIGAAYQQGVGGTFVRDAIGGVANMSQPQFDRII